MDWNGGMDYIWNGLWNMEWTTEFVCSRQHHFTLCSSLPCPFPLCQSLELQVWLLAMYRMSLLKHIVKFDPYDFGGFG